MYQEDMFSKAWILNLKLVTVIIIHFYNRKNIEKKVHRTFLPSPKLLIK